MLRLACITVLLSASSALAQPADADEPPPPPSPPSTMPAKDHGYLGGGALLGFGGGELFQQAFVLEGGLRLGTLPVYAHASGASGGGGDFENTGDFFRALAGLELRQCSGGDGACLVLAMDVGFQTQVYPGDPGEMDEHHHGFVGVSRIGVDTGGEHVRFRATVELSQWHDRSDVAKPTWQLGVGTSFGLAYRL